MPVEWTNGTNWKNGYTWHPMIWVDAQKHPLVPCVEIQWDTDGKPTYTGRYAMMHRASASNSQRKAVATPIPAVGYLPQEPLDDEYLVDHDEAMREMDRINELIG